MKRTKSPVKITPMTIEKYLRKQLKNAGWTNKKTKCYVSGRTNNLEMHHSGKAFGDIVMDAHKKLGIKFKGYMTNYSILDLALLKDEVLKQHKQYVQAITLNEDIHHELHYKYGKNVSMAQLEAFKAEYNSRKKFTA